MLEAGADDYVPKPYNPAELVARIKINFRKALMIRSNPKTEYAFENLRIDLEEKALFWCGEKIVLRKKLFDLLVFLIRHSD